LSNHPTIGARAPAVLPALEREFAMDQHDQKAGTPSRRDFIKTSTAAMVGGTIASSLSGISGAYAAGSDEIRVGVIGCGGRGTGAIDNVLSSAEGVRLVAMGDLFKDRLQDSLKNLAKHGDKAAVAADHQFVGWDAFKKVVATDVNYIILATPPAFRPMHLRAAIEAGKNVFTEKPVAVDPAGIKSVFELADLAKSKNLAVVAGTQRRHHAAYLETLKRVHDGAIGDVVSMRVFWNQGGLWTKPRQAEWTDMEWQLRNWLYFTWLSGDHIVEQHVHNLDVANWVMGDKVPVRVVGVGGRQARTAPEYGNIFDHFGLDYEYENGAHALSMCRQQPGTPGLVAEFAAGSKGTCDTQDGVRYEIKGPSAWKWSGQPVDPYVQEHTDLIASIRGGTPLNELRRVAESTLTAIAGREAAYTGKVVVLEQFLAAPFSLMPSKLEFGPIPVPPVAIPGQGQTM
jgi:myo-inositol 2-dehydrogenase/D-chiro-inositol 1-dehydrogenase